MSTEASTMGIMLMDASVQAQRDQRAHLNFLPQATPRPNAATHTPIGLSRPLAMKLDQWQ